MTAIEWLEKILKQNYGAEFTELNKHIFDKAKEMEKQQIIKSFEEGMFHHINGMCPDEYYNEKFKK